MPEIGPFASVGVSNVFFRMVLGETTPKAIAEALGTKPSTVVEHLRRLQEMGVVRLGEKEGKYQHYEIDWGRFARAFLRHSYTLSLLQEGGRTEELEEMKGVAEELGRMEEFRELLRLYFRELVGNMEGGRYPRRTIWGAIYGFEDSLEILPSLKGRLGERGGKLAALLERWERCAREFRSKGPACALERAMLGLEKP
ncbi:MAG: helix-turn-helix domain-containing protein [Candidatus Hadarchaeales archaeon]